MIAYTAYSIVVPVYRGMPFLEELIMRLEKVLSKHGSHEIILVNDASPDDSWELIKKLAAANSSIKGLNLSRNFGQHYAITAGLSESKGQWIVVMDCDLQDKPEEIEKLIAKSKEGYEVILAGRNMRKDSLFKKMSSRLFYKFLSWLSGVDYDYKVANFGLYKRKVIQSVLTMNDSIRYFPSMVKWVGFKTCTVDVEHGAREAGESSYTFNRMMNLALDIVLSYSDKPIRLAIKAGLLISALSILAAILIFIQKISGMITVPGYASVILSIWMFGGLIIALLGMVGLYVSKTFQQTKGRPMYIISEKINA